METSFNCSVLSNTFTILDTFSVNIYKNNNEIFITLGKNRYDFGKFKVDHLKDYICNRKNVADSDKHAVKLWKINVKKNEIKDNVSTENDIIQNLHGKEMEPEELFQGYFKTELDNQTAGEFVVSNIHIITIIPATTGPSRGVTQNAVDWSNADSIYNWIKELKRPRECSKPMLVGSFGAEFPLQGREKTLEILLNGDEIGSRNGICQRFGFRKNKKYDKQDHHIPILANGPGTGKSRFLQELPTLIENQARNYIGDKELLESLDNRKVLFINVTFNGNTNALEKEISAGPASVALRILYEHFISGGGTISYGHFSSMCNYNWREFTIMSALDVVIRDIDSDINFIILGIDELNCLHSLALAKGKLNPVQEIVSAVGALSCSEDKIFYAPILAGTIQGPLEDMIKESTYDLLRLPLRLLLDNEVMNISSYMTVTRKALADYINHNKTFHRCISDIGGQVRALEIFCQELLFAIDLKTHIVDYKLVMQLVNHRLMTKYPFKKFVIIMKPVVAHAILNIPVNEIDEFVIDGDKNLISISHQKVL